MNLTPFCSHDIAIQQISCKYKFLVFVFSQKGLLLKERIWTKRKRSPFELGFIYQVSGEQTVWGFLFFFFFFFFFGFFFN